MFERPSAGERALLVHIDLGSAVGSDLDAPEELRLLADPVLADLLERLGLQLESRLEPFLPEAGAYASGHHQHGHQDGASDPDHHRHDHGAGANPAAVANP